MQEPLAFRQSPPKQGRFSRQPWHLLNGTNPAWCECALRDEEFASAGFARQLTTAPMSSMVVHHFFACFARFETLRCKDKTKT